MKLSNCVFCARNEKNCLKDEQDIKEDMGMKSVVLPGSKSCVKAGWNLIARQHLRSRLIKPFNEHQHNLRSFLASIHRRTMDRHRMIILVCVQSFYDFSTSKKNWNSPKTTNAFNFLQCSIDFSRKNHLQFSSTCAYLFPRLYNTSRNERENCILALHESPFGRRSQKGNKNLYSFIRKRQTKNEKLNNEKRCKYV